MVVLSRLTDYGVVLVVALARLAIAKEREGDSAHQYCFTAQQLAAYTHVPKATVAKVLKILARAGIVIGIRGVAGGYRLVQPANNINLADIITAMDGPLSFTECSTSIPCLRNNFCEIRPHWQRISQAITATLQDVKIADIAMGTVPLPPEVLDSKLVPTEMTQ